VDWSPEEKATLFALLGRIAEALESMAPRKSLRDQPLLSKPVTEAIPDLSVRARKCLRRLGVVTLADLTARCDFDLLETRNVGTGTVKEVREKLAKLGLSLKGE